MFNLCSYVLSYPVLIDHIYDCYQVSLVFTIAYISNTSRFHKSFKGLKKIKCLNNVNIILDIFTKKSN